MKYRLLRLLGVVSPSGRYATPPRWALNATGKHRFYDAPDCSGDCCPWNRPPARCQLACCRPPAEPLCVPGCEAECCGPLVVSAGALPILTRQTTCAGPCGFCAGVMDPSDRDGLEGREKGAEQC